MTASPAWLRDLPGRIGGPVAVLRGGRSAERAISLDSGAKVLEALERLGLSAYAVDVAEPFTERLRAKPPACAFIALHGIGGEDGTVQRWLETVGIPYTGSGVEASATALDKSRCKRRWREAGLPTPDWTDLEVDSRAAEVLSALGGDAMVKSSCGGSSLGCARATDAASFDVAWQAARESGNGDAVIAETRVDGAEYTVGVLERTALPVIRIVVPDGFYDYHAKYHSDVTEYRLPCGLSSALRAEAQHLALRAYEALGCRHWGRVDLMRDASGHLWLLEVNTVPGLTEHSLVPMAAAAAGLDFDALAGFILAVALDLERELPPARTERRA